MSFKHFVLGKTALSYSGMDTPNPMGVGVSEGVLKHLFANKSVYALQLLWNNQLASGSSDSTTKIWNLDSGECVRTLTGHQLFFIRFNCKRTTNSQADHLTIL